ncbi:MAG: adenylate/guanylate cyclase domain-containing protein [Burkholderiales bacterium]
MSPLSVALGILAASLVAALGLVAVVMKRRQHLLERLLDRTNEKLEQLQIRFSWFAPADIVEHLTSPTGTARPYRRQVTILFADIRGFTTLCDHMDPEAVVPLLNGYFERMSAAITENHGRVTELVGDGILALFGALEPNPWQAQDAVLAALGMRESLRGYNEKLHAAGTAELKIGIGIHLGEVVAGVMGNRELSKFSVVGDAINVASRVEGLTRFHDVDLLITDPVRESLGNRFALRPMPPAAIKGKPEPVQTYWVESLADQPLVPATTS